MSQVLTVGAPFLDLMSGFPLPDRSSKSNRSHQLISLDLSPGAPASNVATGLSRLGVDSAIAGKIGDDWFGNYLSLVLKEDGVDISALIQEESRQTGIIFPIIDDQGIQQDYQILNESIQFELTGSEIRDLSPFEADVLFVDGVLLIGKNGRKALKSALSSAEEQGIPVAFDPNFRLPPSVLKSELQKFLKSILTRIDYLLINDNEFKVVQDVIFPGSDESQIWTLLMEIGIDTVIVKQGGQGYKVVTEGETFSEPAFPVDAVDTQGAGDSYDAGFLAGLIRGLTVEEASMTGNAVAAMVCSQKTAWAPLPTAEELETFLKQNDKQSLLYKFKLG